MRCRSVIDEKTVLKLLVIHQLINRSEWILRELAWEIGVKADELRKLLEELQNNYLLTIEDSKIYWSSADNPSYIKPWGWTLIHRALLGSTQEAARGADPWSIVIAEYMLAGKGRLGKTWKSGLGGLWVTYKIMTKPETASMLPIIVPTILIRTLKRNLKIDAKIKWPNDIVYNGKKLAGILIEAEAFGDRILAYIGIGLNVNNDPPVAEAISLKQITGTLIPRNRILSILTGWIGRIKKLAKETDEIRREYMENLSTIGKRVVVETLDGKSIEGIAIDVNREGSLILDTDKGKKMINVAETYRLRHKEE